MTEPPAESPKGQPSSFGDMFSPVVDALQPYFGARDCGFTDKEKMGDRLYFPFGPEDPQQPVPDEPAKQASLEPLPPVPPPVDHPRESHELQEPAEPAAVSRLPPPPAATDTRQDQPNHALATLGNYLRWATDYEAEHQMPEESQRQDEVDLPAPADEGPVQQLSNSRMHWFDRREQRREELQPRPKRQVQPRSSLEHRLHLPKIPEEGREQEVTARQGQKMHWIGESPPAPAAEDPPPAAAAPKRRISPPAAADPSTAAAEDAPEVVPESLGRQKEAAAVQFVINETIAEEQEIAEEEVIEEAPLQTEAELEPVPIAKAPPSRKIAEEEVIEEAPLQTEAELEPVPIAKAPTSKKSKSKSEFGQELRSLYDRIFSTHHHRHHQQQETNEQADASAWSDSDEESDDGYEEQLKAARGNLQKSLMADRKKMKAEKDGKQTAVNDHVIARVESTLKDLVRMSKEDEEGPSSGKATVAQALSPSPVIRNVAPGSPGVTPGSPGVAPGSPSPGADNADEENVQGDAMALDLGDEDGETMTVDQRYWRQLANGRVRHLKALIASEGHAQLEEDPMEVERQEERVRSGKQRRATTFEKAMKREVAAYQEIMKGRLVAMTGRSGHFSSTLDPAEAVKESVLKYYKTCEKVGKIGGKPLSLQQREKISDAVKELKSCEV